MSAKEIKQEKWRIWKNITVISGSFMCLFTAYNAVANLQVCSSTLFVFGVDEMMIDDYYIVIITF